MTAATTNLLRHVRQLVEGRPLDRLTDHQLLEGFAARREEAMFAQLVRRHGSMVLSVCRRIVRPGGTRDVGTIKTKGISN